MCSCVIFFFLFFASCSLAPAGDLAKVDRSIAKEPKYAGKPNYCLLVFGSDAKHRVWLVHDGDSLYVDRNGNGDLTEAGEKVAARKRLAGEAEGAFEFEVGELHVGGKTHKGMEIGVFPLKMLADNPNLMTLPQVARTVKKNPDAVTAVMKLDVECANLKGGGVGRRVSYMLSVFDIQGVLKFGATPAEAPIIHFDGPLQISFFTGKPTWTGGGTQDTILCIGTPGVGPGTFAMVKYEGAVPEGTHPKIEATYQPKDPAQKPVKELYELKERC